jgi:hypothetical protein
VVVVGEVIMEAEDFMAAEDLAAAMLAAVDIVNS